jgi:hypothetical protein
MVERVMILDAILADRRCWWLSPADDACARHRLATTRSWLD